MKNGWITSFFREMSTRRFDKMKNDSVINRKATEFAESKNDFAHKLHIALKEANETDYWLLLLSESNYIEKTAYDSIQSDCTELIKLLVSIIKTAKSNS